MPFGGWIAVKPNHQFVVPLRLVFGLRRQHFHQFSFGETLPSSIPTSQTSVILRQINQGPNLDRPGAEFLLVPQHSLRPRPLSEYLPFCDLTSPLRLDQVDLGRRHVLEWFESYPHASRQGFLGGLPAPV